MEKTLWHTMEAGDVVASLHADISDGLTPEEAAGRLESYGPNLLREPTPVSPAVILVNQFKDFMIYVLLAAVVISGVWLREYVDAVVILMIVVANAALGFIQEMRAEKALVALRRLGAPTARVLRSGKTVVIPAHDLVPGDIMLLEAGDLVAGDARLLETHSLKANESSLTGESEPATKHADFLAGEKVPPGDRVNMAFLGTHIVHGRGHGVVVGTGQHTEMGKIASMLEEGGETRTPLQVELQSTGKRIALLAMTISAVIFAVGAARSVELAEMLLFSVSLAVAAIPEGLPAIVTVVLALGVQRMAKEKAILRRLHAVETLGSASVICSDKTGTLTKSEMQVREWHGAGAAGEPTRALLSVAALCNDARQQDDHFIGDSTEVALVKAAVEAGLTQQELQSELPRLEEIPFESERKMMSTVHGVVSPVAYQEFFPGAGHHPMLLLTKGAPEMVLARCSRIAGGGDPEPLSEQRRQALEEEAASMAERALRTLALAYRPLDRLPESDAGTELEEELVFLGLVGMSDPPRPEVFDALATCREAHIDVVMITGDHAVTARAIASELGILTDDKRLMTGEELEDVSVEELERQVEEIAVYARVSPAHKVKIVEAWKSRNRIVAMTGDGVNDAPALKRADIGVAMGITGTDVSKEAADMVLADDNFATIVNAIREGRIVFANLKKFIYFLLSCNISEVATMFVAMLLSAAVPLRAVQVLWINLVTDGFPAMALGVDAPERGIMRHLPRDPSEGILSWRRQRWILAQGTVLSLGGITSFYLAIHLLGLSTAIEGELKQIQTIVFTTLVFAQLLHSMNFHSETVSFWQANPLRNKALVLALAASVGLQLVVILVPSIMDIFGTCYLPAKAWLVVAGSCVLPVLAIDRLKVWRAALLKRQGRAL
ncbi:MAG: cation-translocating P-type ATPase [Candidatus Geothermincolia bacterium]